MKRMRAVILPILVLLVLAACQPQSTGSEADLVATSTAVMQTAEALGTRLAGLTGTPVAPATVTVPPPTATATPLPTATPTSTLTATTVPAWNSCDAANLVSETIVDGAALTPGTKFTKTWKLLNIGSCTWDPSYRLVFESGTAMTGILSKQLTSGEVKPGDTVEVSMTMTAPEIPGDYTGFWKLSNTYGNRFGMGGLGKAFWVYIKVGPATSDPFRVTSARVITYPVNFSGYCGNGVDVYVTGYIRTNKAGTVKFSWDGHDLGAGPYELEFIGGDEMIVSRVITYYSGYHEQGIGILINYPNAEKFDEANFVVDCNN